ncbi:MAG: hypothetical protein ACLSA2_07220 [Candidatus Gastranaerophilaceae bacterium]
MALNGIRTYITNTSLYKGASRTMRTIQQKGLDLIPDAVYSGDKITKNIKNTGEKISSAEQRLILGATALMTQPFIDANNKSVDEKTRKVSVARTIASCRNISRILYRKDALKVLRRFLKYPDQMCRNTKRCLLREE